jgi:hypothetical protein
LHDINFQSLRDVFAGTVNQEQKMEFWDVLTETKAAIKSLTKNRTVPREEGQHIKIYPNKSL